MDQRKLSQTDLTDRANHVLSVSPHHPPLTGRKPRGLPASPVFTWGAVLEAWARPSYEYSLVCLTGERWSDYLLLASVPSDVPLRG